MHELDVDSLLRAAREARKRAYAPYSRFAVGAALLTASGQVFLGCNIENASYGLTSCAERTALFAAVAAGCRPGELEALAILADAPAPVAPCGACRQVMIELGGPRLIVIQANLRGQIARSSAQDLLPGAFTLAPERRRRMIRDDSDPDGSRRLRQEHDRTRTRTAPEGRAHRRR